EVQPALLGHVQFGAPAVDEGVVIAVLEDGKTGRGGRGQLHQAEIDLEALEQVFRHVRQLLDIIEHGDLFQRQAEVFLQIQVGGFGNRGDDGPAQVDRDAVRLLVV